MMITMAMIDHSPARMGDCGQTRAAAAAAESSDFMASHAPVRSGTEAAAFSTKPDYFTDP